MLFNYRASLIKHPSKNTKKQNDYDSIQEKNG